ncbi:hypothetical protein PHLGIDRAFT_97651 [Phlebiopsis gigantea 11061_1 CR5-6]|uniref:Cyanovirin-N domain-containing protein n=1 Tax=Phlebiopsis gigantea (strain 11061_1 CR5-6) TaxID=745531 RepID=A0A0C3SFY4_PHLG1|nr:hypothetical protein PHLGIDRAFT_97651 [Phlebiopsis gigantea 11061_1 CR5-6]
MAQFSKTCSNIKLDGSVLSASCRTSSGGTKPSSVDLDKHIGNTDGYFDISGTNYTTGAKDASLISRTVLSDELITSDGKSTRKARINLDNYVGNNSGSLTWVMTSKGDFASSSSHLSLKGTILSATCKKSDGSSTQSSLDLSDHLGNMHGSLDFISKGFQDASESIELDGTVLKVQLRGDGDEVFCNMLDLNLHVGNDEGKLTWKTLIRV